MQAVTVPNSERNMEKKMTGEEMKESGEEIGPRKTRDNLNREQTQTKRKVGKVRTKNLIKNLVLNVHPQNIARQNVGIIHSSMIGHVDIAKPVILHCSTPQNSAGSKNHVIGHRDKVSPPKVTSLQLRKTLFLTICKI